MLRKTVVCSYRMYALPLAEKKRILNTAKVRSYHVQADMHCPDWEFYVFDAKGRMRSYVIQEWMPKKKPTLWVRIKEFLG